MDTLIKKYRTKHKRCKWCKYQNYVIPHNYVCYPFYECVLKDKIITFSNNAIFCKYYTLKEDDE